LVFGAVLILLPFVVPLATHAFTRHTTITTLAYLYGGRQIIQLCLGEHPDGLFHNRLGRRSFHCGRTHGARRRVFCIFTRAAFAVGGAILAPLLSIAIVSAIAYWFDIEMGDNDLMLTRTVMWLAITGICFPVGTWYFLHRVRP